MLLLCSNGLTSQPLLHVLRKHTQDLQRAALVVTADNIYKENNYHVSRCKQTLTSLGLSVEIFDLDTEDAVKLLNYDVIEFIGGNPFYLLDAIRRCNAQTLLERCAKERILIGWSAAAFVFGPTLELVNQYSPDMNFMDRMDLHGLALTDLQVLPHYSRFLEKIPRFEEICAEYEQQHAVSVLRLNDGDGVLIHQKETCILREE